MEVASLPGTSNKHIEEWSTLNKYTGVLEHARIEADRWASTTSNSSHHFGKVVDSRARSMADGSVQEKQQTKQLEMFQASIPGGSVQVIRSHTSTTSHWHNSNIISNGNNSQVVPDADEKLKNRIKQLENSFNNFNLNHHGVNLDSEKSKIDLGRNLRNRRPPTRSKIAKNDFQINSLLEEVPNVCNTIHAEATEMFNNHNNNNNNNNCIENIKNHIIDYDENGNNIDHRPLEFRKSTSNENLQSDESDEWKRSSKMRWSFQYPKVNGKSENSEEIIKPKGLVKRKSFVTDETLKETKERLRHFNKDEDSAPEMSSFKTSKNDDWYNRRKSYAFESVYNTPKIEDEMETKPVTISVVEAPVKGTVLEAIKNLRSNGNFELRRASEPNSNEYEKKLKKVGFCKTEVHFAAEPGKLNIVETDGKPPPTNMFRRRKKRIDDDSKSTISITFDNKRTTDRPSSDEGEQILSDTARTFDNGLAVTISSGSAPIMETRRVSCPENNQKKGFSTTVNFGCEGTTVFPESNVQRTRHSICGPIITDVTLQDNTNTCKENCEEKLIVRVGSRCSGNSQNTYQQKSTFSNSFRKSLYDHQQNMINSQQDLKSIPLILKTMRPSSSFHVNGTGQLINGHGHSHNLTTDDGDDEKETTFDPFKGHTSLSNGYNYPLSNGIGKEGQKESEFQLNGFCFDSREDSDPYSDPMSHEKYNSHKSKIGNDAEPPDPYMEQLESNLLSNLKNTINIFYEPPAGQNSHDRQNFESETELNHKNKQNRKYTSQKQNKDCSDLKLNLNLVNEEKNKLTNGSLTETMNGSHDPYIAQKDSSKPRYQLERHSEQFKFEKIAHRYKSEKYEQSMGQKGPIDTSNNSLLSTTSTSQLSDIENHAESSTSDYWSNLTYLEQPSTYLAEINKLQKKYKNSENTKKSFYNTIPGIRHPTFMNKPSTTSKVIEKSYSEFKKESSQFFSLNEFNDDELLSDDSLKADEEVRSYMSVVDDFEWSDSESFKYIQPIKIAEKGNTKLKDIIRTKAIHPKVSSVTINEVNEASKPQKSENKPKVESQEQRVIYHKVSLPTTQNKTKRTEPIKPKDSIRSKKIAEKKELFNTGRDSWLNIPKERPSRQQEIRKQPVQSKLEVKSSCNDATIEELNRAANEILLAVNGYTDGESILTSDDDLKKKSLARSYQPLTTISEKPTDKKSIKTIQGRSFSKITKIPVKQTSSNSSLESYTQESKKLLKTEERSKRRAARMLQRATSREQLLNLNAPSSSDVGSDVEIEKPKPRVRKTKVTNRVSNPTLTASTISSSARSSRYYSSSDRKQSSGPTKEIVHKRLEKNIPSVKSQTGDEQTRRERSRLQHKDGRQTTECEKARNTKLKGILPNSRRLPSLSRRL